MHLEHVSAHIRLFSHWHKLTIQQCSVVDYLCRQCCSIREVFSRPFADGVGVGRVIPRCRAIRTSSAHIAAFHLLANAVSTDETCPVLNGLKRFAGGWQGRIMLLNNSAEDKY